MCSAEDLLQLLIPKNSQNFNEIEEHVFLGACDIVFDHNSLKKLNIRRVLTIMDAPIPQNKKIGSIEYRFIYAQDMIKEDILSVLPECCKFIADAQNNKENVYVHCFAGISRSSSLVIGYLMKKYQIDFEEAFKKVADKRMGVNPNKGFIEQLKLWKQWDYKVSASNVKYRHYLVERLVFYKNFLHVMPVEAQLDSYFCKILNAEGSVLLSREKAHVCVNCQEELFHRSNILDCRIMTTIDNHEASENCPYIYLEPMSWMKINDPLDFTIKCPKCETVLGKFNIKSFTCCQRHSLIGELKIVQMLRNSVTAE